MAMRKQETTTRADLLRRKREKTPRNLNWRSRPAERRPVPPQPVWNIQPRGAAPRVHRVYSIALESPGVEVQLPALAVSFSPRSLAILVAGLACAGLLFMLTGPMFRAEEPQIVGLQNISADAVNAAAGLGGSNLFLISPSAVEQQILAKIPAIRSVAGEHRDVRRSEGAGPRARTDPAVGAGRFVLLGGRRRRILPGAGRRSQRSGPRGRARQGAADCPRPRAGYRSGGRDPGAAAHAGRAHRGRGFCTTRITGWGCRISTAGRCISERRGKSARRWMSTAGW